MALSKVGKYWHTRFMIRGRSINESTKCECKDMAKRYEVKRMQEVREEVLLNLPKAKTWNEAVDMWKAEKADLKSLHQHFYRLEWLQPILGNMKLKDITSDVIRDVVNRRLLLQNEGSTINRYLSTIRGILKMAANEWHWIDKVPKITLKKENERTRYLKKDQQEDIKLFDAIKSQHLLDMVQFALATGLRSANIVGMKWEHINWLNGWVFVEASRFKNGTDYCCILNKDALSILNRLKLTARSDFVFTYLNEPIVQANTTAYRRAVKAAGLGNFTFHDLRHTWASWHVMNGTSLLELQQLGGWKDYKSVLRYSHLSQQYLREISNNICQNFVKDKKDTRLKEELIT